MCVCAGMSGIRYQVSGLLILPGELLARGYSTQHPEDVTDTYKGTHVCVPL